MIQNTPKKKLFSLTFIFIMIGVAFVMFGTTPTQGESLYEYKISIRFYAHDDHEEKNWSRSGEFRADVMLIIDGDWIKEESYTQNGVDGGEIHVWEITHSSVWLDRNDEIAFRLWENDNSGGDDYISPDTDGYYWTWDPPTSDADSIKEYERHSDQEGCWVQVNVEYLGST